MTEILASEASLTTKPSLDGEKPLPKRAAPKTLLPSTWLERTVKVAYVDCYGSGCESTGTLLDLHPFGVIVSLNGERTALAWDSLRAVTLVED